MGKGNHTPKRRFKNVDLKWEPLHKGARPRIWIAKSGGLTFGLREYPNGFPYRFGVEVEVSDILVARLILHYGRGNTISEAVEEVLSIFDKELRKGIEDVEADLAKMRKAAEAFGFGKP